MNGEPVAAKGVTLRELYTVSKKSLFAWIIVVVAIWAISAVAILYFLPGWPQRGQFGDLFGAVNSLFAGLGFAGVVVALLLQNHGLVLQNRSLGLQLDELTKAHDWNRRKSAHDLVFEASLGKFAVLRGRIEDKIDIYNPRETFETVKASLTRADILTVDAALNFLENVCLAIKNNVVDEPIVYDALGDVLVAYFRWAKPYITESRHDISEEFWCEIDPFARQWAAQAEEGRKRIEAARTSALTPGHKKL